MAGQPAKLSDWLSVVRRARLGRTVKAVAHVLATRVNNDGTGLFTGIARLSVECEMSPKVVKQSLRTLREVGLIELVRASKGRGDTNEYQLSLPVDGPLAVPTPAAHLLEVERVASSLRGKWKSDLRGTGDPAGSAEDSDLQGTSNTAGHPDDVEPAGYFRDTEEPPAGYGRDDLRGTPYPATSPLPRHEGSTSPIAGELRTDLEVVGEPTPDQDPISDGEEKPRLRLVRTTGNGFCLDCYAAGQFTVAVDEEHGSACAMHLREAS